MTTLKGTACFSFGSSKYRIQDKNLYLVIYFGSGPRKQIYSNEMEEKPTKDV